MHPITAEIKILFYLEPGGGPDSMLHGFGFVVKVGKSKEAKEFLSTVLHGSLVLINTYCAGDNMF